MKERGLNTHRTGSGILLVQYLLHVHVLHPFELAAVHAPDGSNVVVFRKIATHPDVVSPRSRERELLQIHGTHLSHVLVGLGQPFRGYVRAQGERRHGPLLRQAALLRATVLRPRRLVVEMKEILIRQRGHPYEDNVVRALVKHGRVLLPQDLRERGLLLLRWRDGGRSRPVPVQRPPHLLLLRLVPIPVHRALRWILRPSNSHQPRRPSPLPPRQIHREAGLPVGVALPRR